MKSRLPALLTAILLCACVLVASPSYAQLAKPPYPVIFIHGINSSAGTWDRMKTKLEADGWKFGGFPQVLSGQVVGGNTVGDFYTMNMSDWVLDYPSQNLTLEEQGLEVSKVIQHVLKLTGKSKVILVGHSMGGLAARAYIQSLGANDYAGDVARLIMIGTPNLGSSALKYCNENPDSWQCDIFVVGSAMRGTLNLSSAAVKLLRPGSAELNALNNNSASQLTSDKGIVDYVSLASEGDMTLLAIQGLSGDGVVTLDSQIYVGTLSGLRKTTAIGTVNWSADCATKKNFLASAIGQVHTCETRDSGIMQDVERHSLRAVIPWMTAPTAGASLAGSSVKFQWSSGAGVSEYFLYVGTTPGGHELYAENLGAKLSATVSGVPTDGRKIYARLYSFADGDWTSKDNDYTFTAANVALVPAQMTSPTPSTKLTSSSATFQWSATSGATKYSLYVGTAQAGVDIYAADRGTNLSATVSGLPTHGETVFVRLFTQFGSTSQFRDYTYTASGAANALAALTSPSPSSTLTSSSTNFQWSAGTGVTQYFLYVGRTAGGYEYYGADRGTNLSAAVSALPTNGSTVYVRLFSLIDNVWQYRDYTYTSTTLASAPAQLTSPAPSSTLSASTVVFQWSGGTNVSSYFLYVGRTAGTGDIFAADRGGNLNATVSGLPTNGSAVYVRLWSLMNGAWQYRDYTYTSSGVATAPAQMTTPAPSSTLTASTVNFQWSGGTGVSQYFLYVGTTSGGHEIFGADRGTSLSAIVSGLPTNGSTVYVRLYSMINGAWQQHDYTYTAATVATAPAQMTSPAPSSTLSASTVQFQWTGGSGVTSYFLYVGRTAGGSEFFGADRGTALTATVSGLPTNASTVHVRLWSLINGAWQYRDYTYTSSGVVTAPAQVSSPSPGSTLSASTVNFQWSGGTGVTQYFFYVGTTAGGHEIYAADRGTNLSATVPGLPTNGSTIYVRLFSLINGVWQQRDYTYAAVTIATAPAQMTSPAPSSTLTASTVQFQWNGGSGVSSYFLYVGTSVGGSQLFGADLGTNLAATVSGLPTNGSAVYVRLYSLINGAWQYRDYAYTASTVVLTPAQMTSPAPSSTLTASTVLFQWSGGSGVSGYFFYVGTAVGTGDIYGADRGTNLNATVTGLPTNGRTLYVRLWSMINGAWQYRDYTYTAVTVVTGVAAQMSSPNPSSTLASATITFQWTTGSNVTSYFLNVGTTVGGAEIYGADRGTSLSTTVSGLPTNGRTVYVRLWSLINGAYQYRDYNYTSVTIASSTTAQLISPAPFSRLTSSTATFQWSAGSGVSSYFLYVGTTLGGNDLYGADRGTSLTATVSGLPTTGRPLFVRLWSYIGGVWYYNDYALTSK